MSTSIHVIGFVPPDEKWARMKAVTQLGECMVTRFEDPETGQERLNVVHADPRIEISVELLDEISRIYSPWVTFDGDLLRIEASNRTVIYRVFGTSPDGLTRYAEWPD